jgi:hypothetical protein
VGKLLIVGTPVGMALGLWAHLLLYGPLPGPTQFGQALVKGSPRLDGAELGDQVGIPDAVVKTRARPPGRPPSGAGREAELPGAEEPAAGGAAAGPDRSEPRPKRESAQPEQPELLSPVLQEVLEDMSRHRRQERRARRGQGRSLE